MKPQKGLAVVPGGCLPPKATMGELRAILETLRRLGVEPKGYDVVSPYERRPAEPTMPSMARRCR